MTPELKTACELVFQEHKTSSQIKWDRYAFRGRISIGLSEMAKQTLVKKNIILLPDKSKKIVTLLNPAVASAESVEEAEEMIVTKTATPAVTTADEPLVFTTEQAPGFATSDSDYSDRLLLVADQPATMTNGTKWYMRPLFYYLIWPLCALAAGALTAYLLGLAFMGLIAAIK